MKNDTYLLAERLECYLAYIYAIQEDATLIRIIETRNETNQSTFTGARGSNDRYYLSCFSFERNIFQRFETFFVAKADSFKCDLAVSPAYLNGARSIFDLRFRIE